MTDRPTDKELQRRDPIFARRDGDMGGPQSSNARTSTEHGGTRGKSGGGQPAKTGNGLMMIIIFILIVCLSGLGWFSWQQSQGQNLLQERFDVLVAQTDSTDESLSQSGAALSVRLSDQKKALAEQGEDIKKQWSEIKKLWGVSNDRNKKAIKALEKSIANTAKKHESLEKKISAISAEQSKLSNVLGELGSNSLATGARIDELDQTVGGVEDAQQSLGQTQRSFENRLQGMEDVIESIDGFRRQTNQSLEDLRRAQSIP